ncbi:MAG: aldehyde ferredoxin oxidoreductase family protein [Proteobacteria bacterium]|nr:aldehyde ferredoxin oxidoreductase family protein [Pseudomonadota bacterium]
MAGGYTGKYCVIDLTKQKTEVVEPGEEFYKKYLTGYGLGAAVITERQKPGIDPLSPEAHLGICSGLLSGTKASFSGRFLVVGKSPLTGGWGDANSGGFLSREIKRTGYDAVFFTGASKKPVWVNITDETVEFRDAKSLWGKDNVETNEAIKKELKDKKVQVASIGVSGEKLSLISGVTTDDGRIAARSGLGAVMGSKKLKAVAFRGKLDIPVADPDKMKALTKKLREDLKKSKGGDRLMVKIMGFLSKVIAKTGMNAPSTSSVVKEIYKKYGTPGLNIYSAMVGDTPIKNWDGVGYTDFTYQRVLNISGDKVIENQKKKYACQNCPLGCGGIMDIKKGRFAGTEGHKPEYETWGSFGGMLLNDDYDSILECNELCNRAGIDTISAGCTVAFAVECFENGVIDEKTTGGLKLGWGRSDEIVKLTEMIVDREGFGDVLADGVKVAAQKIGNGAEKYAVHAGGQELPMHDSKLDPGYGIAYQCEPTPGRHTISCFMYASLFSVEQQFPAVKSEVKKTKDRTAKDVKLYTAGTVLMQLMNGCGMCEFGAMVVFLPMVDYLNAATGWNLTPEEYYKTGERLLSIRKAFNVREGIKPEDSRLHDRAVGTVPQTQGPLKGVTIDIDGLQKEFFNTVGWDPSTGGPTVEKMKELGIDSLFSA